MAHEDKISGVTFNTASRTGAIDFREEYNKMMANITGKQQKKMPPIFGNGFAASNGVNKAATDFNG